ncbi:MAG: hypothetical protein HZB47_15220 [Nitrosomonadales bacterium]|nr:hypothetical protein [Nitrosomonadales bacterium]
MGRTVHFLILGWLVALTATVSACAQPVKISQAPASTGTKPELGTTEEEPRVPDEYLITLSPDADKGVIAEHFGRYGIKDIYALGGETYLLVLVNDPGPQQMVALVDEDSRVMAIQPNLVFWDNRSGSITK